MKKMICFISVTLCLSFLCSCSRADTYRAEMKLSNANANETTKKVYSYICDTYGNGTISAQQESTWMGSTEYEMDYVYDAAGKYPAMRGLDFMDDDFDGVVQRAADWWNKGGLVTICWHCGPNFDGNYDNCKNDEIENWNLVLTDGTAENKAFMENMDNAGKALLKLQKSGVTVLWRPFHEFDGAWFWWGKGGAENFKKLWIMMYDHFTKDLGLNNLIWVLGYSHNGYDYKGKPAEWYPGDAYCDIVGADSYEVEENGAEKRLYKIVRRITNGKKPLIFHECGLIPTVEQLKKTPWCSFMPWHTEYLIDTNTKESLHEIYNSDYVITLDELPSFK
ncbi:MAG: glycoside hydrolase family 26 protein [Eubacterium sp.]|nr:glycoside hydrolase family 26 protein [Eubacterium sp.]